MARSAYPLHLFGDTIAKITDAGWDYFTNNSITFRARIAQSFDNGNTYVLSLGPRSLSSRPM